jgi:cytochrome c oxidase subunit 2
MKRSFWFPVLAGAFLLGSSACNAPQSTLHPGGPAAADLSNLGWIIYVFFAVVSLIMWALLAWVALRRRGSLETHAPWNEGGGQKGLLIFGFAIPFACLSAIFGLTMSRMNDFPLRDADTNKAEIEVIGHQWWWEVRYIGGPPDTQFTTANEIHVPVGRPVNLLLRSDDVIHSFWVPKLHGKVDLIPGQPNFIRIEASAPGEYEGECGEFCGAEHARMRLLVIADPPQEYAAWKANQLEPGPQPTSQQALEGQHVFMAAACVLCHTVRGTEAHGLIGPDLTHIASRRMIAANVYVNNTANLEAWVTHAQSLKPEVVMPNLTQFNGKQLIALVTYLQELK